VLNCSGLFLVYKKSMKLSEIEYFDWEVYTINWVKVPASHIWYDGKYFISSSWDIIKRVDHNWNKSYINVTTMLPYTAPIYQIYPLTMENLIAYLRQKTWDNSQQNKERLIADHKKMIGRIMKRLMKEQNLLHVAETQWDEIWEAIKVKSDRIIADIEQLKASDEFELFEVDHSSVSIKFKYKPMLMNVNYRWESLWFSIISSKQNTYIYDIRNGSIRIDNLQRTLHPNISLDRSICFGNMLDTINMLLSDQDVWPVFAMFKSFLCTWDMYNPYNRILRHYADYNFTLADAVFKDNDWNIINEYIDYIKNNYEDWNRFINDSHYIKLDSIKKFKEKHQDWTITYDDDHSDDEDEDEDSDYDN